MTNELLSKTDNQHFHYDIEREFVELWYYLKNITDKSGHELQKECVDAKIKLIETKELCEIICFNVQIGKRIGIRKNMLSVIQGKCVNATEVIDTRTGKIVDTNDLLEIDSNDLKYLKIQY